MKWLNNKFGNNEYIIMTCLDGRDRMIRRSKDYRGEYHYCYNIMKNGDCWGASHGSYTLNKKIFGDLI